MVYACSLQLGDDAAHNCWFGFWLKPETFDFSSPYHPFKSAQAKTEYLRLYDKRAKLWPVDSVVLKIKTTQGETLVRMSGPDNAEPIILLHGAGGNSLQWMSNIKAFSKDYRVYALDIMFAQGHSIPSQAFTDAKDYVNWLDEVLQQISPQQKVSLVGLSYGGWITAQYVKAFPEKLHKAVLLAPAGVVAPLSTEFIVRAVLVAVPIKFFAQQFMRWLADDTYKGSAKLQQLVEDHIDEAYLAVRSFKSSSIVYPNVFSDQELQGLALPMLFLVGENEKIYSPNMVLERLHKVAPHIQTQLIKGAGHDLSMVKAKQVNELILKFLSRDKLD
jgi:pimeloyl-ACP methyl ester carboxylesterase